MTSETEDKIPLRKRLRNKFQLTPRQKDTWRNVQRILIAILGGGVMICFTNFTLLVQLTEGMVIFLLAALSGLLVGLISTEIHYAVLSGLTAPFMGIIIYVGVIIGPLQLFVSPQLGNVFVVIALYSVIRTIHIQIFGVLFGSFIGRVVGPDWH